MPACDARPAHTGYGLTLNMDDDKRNPPWTLNTIGEVIESMEQLKEKGLSDETPIVWYHLENHNLEGQEIENIMILDDVENVEDRKHWVEITLQEIE